MLDRWRGAAIMAGVVLTSCGTSPATSVAGAETRAPTALPAATASPPASTPSASSAAVSSCEPPATTPPAGTINASFPTALAFAPDGRLFYAERSGTIRVWQGGGSHVFASVPTVTIEAGGGYSERGLLGLAISPTFTHDRLVFALYSDADYAHQRVVRWRDCAGKGLEATVVVTLPAGPDCCHKGGRLAFGPDRKLYVSLGEQHVAQAAQATDDPRGKILRYNPDGSVPADNPFGAGNPVWAFGFRNPYGLTFSATGQMAVTSNGPTGDAGSPSTGYDTVVSAVARGAGYQWPLCYGYSHPLRSTTCGAGQHAPDWSSETATVVPTGAAFVDASGPAGEAGHLVFCSFAGGMLILTPGPGHATVTAGPNTCRLDVAQSPDHALYHSDTTHIYRQT